jgi:hypothetical protein
LLLVIKLAFSDFWQYPFPFEPENNFFVHALRHALEGIEVVDPSACDVLIYGPFGDSHRKHRDCLKIFYTGENLPPDYSCCHYALTFNPDPCGGRNLRLPLWYHYIDWFNVKSYGSPHWLIPLKLLNGSERFSGQIAERFCAIVYGKPVRSRKLAIKAFDQYKHVDVYGKAKRATPLPDGELAKLQALSGYRFSLCYENSISEGYHTEKLLHGKVAGGIPIYYGHSSVAADFNPECCIHAASMPLAELVELVRRIDQSPAAYRQLVEQPLFSELPDLASLIESLSRLVRSAPEPQLSCSPTRTPLTLNGQGWPRAWRARLRRFTQRLLNRVKRLP